MTFVPQAGTPLADVPPAGDAAELLTIADDAPGHARALSSPPRSTSTASAVSSGASTPAPTSSPRSCRPTVGLAGVSQAELDIDEGYRTVAGVLPHLDRLGLRAAHGGRVSRPGWRRRVHARGPRGEDAPGRRRQAAGHRGRLPGRQGRLGDRARGPARGAAGRGPRRPRTWSRTSPPTRRSRAALVTACDAVLPACEDLATLAWLAEHVPGLGRAAALRPGRYRVTRSPSWPRSGCSPSSTCRGRRRGRPAAFRPWSSRARPAAARASRWSHDEAELDAARRALEAAGHERRSSRSTWPARRSRSRCWPGAAAPCRCRSPASSSTPPTTASAWWRRWARPGPEGLRPPAPTARAPGTRRAARHAGTPSTPSAVRLAEGLGLRGLMDVEVMVRGARAQGARDRRPPAQPDADRGVLVERPQHRRAAARDRAPRRAAARSTARRGAPACTSTSALATVCWRCSASTSWGAPAPLRLVAGFFGADEALTDYAPGAP